MKAIHLCFLGAASTLGLLTESCGPGATFYLGDASPGGATADGGAEPQVLRGQRDDDDRYTGVVEVNGGCSGTLIDRRHVLTAGHCVCQYYRPMTGPACLYDALHCSTTASVRFVRYLNQDNRTVGGSVRVHPSYRMELDGTCRSIVNSTSDLAVITLDADAPSGYIPVAPARAVPQVGDGITVAGFGHNICEFNGAILSGFGTRRYGTNRVALTESEFIKVSRVVLSSSAVTAPGDSGGPLFSGAGDGLRVAGVTSAGSCGRLLQEDFSWFTSTAGFYDWIVGAAGCLSGTTMCGSTCTNLQSDRANCGVCGRACGAGQNCVAGSCTGGGPTCPTGQTLCGSACVDISSSAANCGGCGRACVAGSNATATCVASTCRLMCSSGTADCNGVASDGCEVVLGSNPSHCGVCGRACGVGQNCTVGSCTGGGLTCPAGQTACGGACVDTSSSAANCGSCGRACGAGQYCTAGLCTSSTRSMTLVLSSSAQVGCSGGYTLILYDPRGAERRSAPGVGLTVEIDDTWQGHVIATAVCGDYTNERDWGAAGRSAAAAQVQSIIVNGRDLTSTTLICVDRFSSFRNRLAIPMSPSLEGRCP